MKDLLTEFESFLINFFNSGSKNSFRRCSHDNELWDYVVYVTHKKCHETNVEEKNGVNDSFHSIMVSHLIEESKSCTLKIKSVQTSQDHIFIYLNKVEAYFRCFHEVARCGSKYGTSTSFLGKRLLLTTDLNRSSPSTLTESRIAMAEKVLKEIIVFGGAVVTNDPDDKEIYRRIHLGCKPFRKASHSTISGSSKVISVAPVLKDGFIMPNDFKRKRKEDLMIKNQVSSNLTDSEQDSLIDAAVLFELLKSKLSKPIRLVEHMEKDRGAIFSIYNYARLRLILDKFDEKCAEGIYPKLPPLEDLDFSLLIYEDEWRLVFDFVLAFPSVLSITLKSLIEDSFCNSDCKIHFLINFMQRLSVCISSYYSKIQILREPRPQLLPYMFVRIYLLKTVITVMDNCFALLGIKPLLRM